MSKVLINYFFQNIKFNENIIQNTESEIRRSQIKILENIDDNDNN